MSSATDGASSTDDYEKLPDAIKLVCSRKEFLWLSDAEKARIEQDFTEPEWQ